MARRDALLHRSRQRGVVLIFTLIVLLVLTIGAVALMRSMNSSLFSAGNLSFRRDLVNQGEQAAATVLVLFKSGGALATSTVSNNNLPSQNYSAQTLVTNNQGVPNALLLTDNTAWAAYGQVLNDSGVNGVTVRYIIDRLCSVQGAASSSLCVQTTGVPTGGTANRNTAVAPPSATVYRLSVRVTGPRNTQVFLQSTFTRPD